MENQLQPSNSNNLPSNQREKLQRGLYNAYNYFSVRDKYDSRISEQQKIINEEYAKYRALVVPSTGKMFGGPIVIYITFSLLFILLMNLITQFARTMLWLIAIAFIVCLVTAIISNKLYQKAIDKKSIKKADAYWHSDGESIVNQSENNIATLKKEKTQFENNNVGYLNIVPPDYRDKFSIAYMLRAMVNLRADTLKEAINLLEQQLHRWKIEKTAEAILLAQCQILVEVEQINKTLY